MGKPKHSGDRDESDEINAGGHAERHVGEVGQNAAFRPVQQFEEHGQAQAPDDRQREQHQKEPPFRNARRRAEAQGADSLARRRHRTSRQMPSDPAPRAGKGRRRSRAVR